MNKDKKIVLTLDAGGTNFVFSAICDNEEIVEPVRLKAVTTDTEGCLATLVQGFTTVKEKLDVEPVAISFAFPRTGSCASASISGGLDMGIPSLSRDRMDARSNLKPSTCMFKTQ